jgi:hypothetical protein
MTSIFDDTEIAIPCKSCGHETKKSVRWMKANRQFTCRCGTVINLHTDELLREIAKVEAEIAKLNRTVKSLNK